MSDWSILDNGRGDPLDVTVRLSGASGDVVIDGKIHGGMSFTVIDGAEFCLGTDMTSPDRYMLTNLFAKVELQR